MTRPTSLVPKPWFCRGMVLQGDGAAGNGAAGALCCRGMVVQGHGALGAWCCRDIVLQGDGAAGAWCCRGMLLQRVYFTAWVRK